MKQCDFCAHQNIEGVIFCEECGNPLTGQDFHISPSHPTTRFDSNNLHDKEIETALTFGTSLLSSEGTIVLDFADQKQSIKIMSQSEKTIGRSDESRNTTPDIDLTPYQAVQAGVSRLHASLSRKDDSLTIMDLDSANGTYLNGHRLVPYQLHILRDGDEIRLGKFKINIYFQ